MLTFHYALKHTRVIIQSARILAKVLGLSGFPRLSISKLVKDVG